VNPGELNSMVDNREYFSISDTATVRVCGNNTVEASIRSQKQHGELFDVPGSVRDQFSIAFALSAAVLLRSAGPIWQSSPGCRISNNIEMNLPLTGIIPPMITPLRNREDLDVSGLERVIEHILAGGVSGLFILGTTGEGPSLGCRLRRELVERVCRQVNRRVPVLVGITDTAFVESMNLARHSADCGADAIVASPPYHMPEAQPELAAYFDHLATESPLPLFLYNMPPLTKVNIEPDTVRRAMDHPKIIGLKDSSGDLAYFRIAAGLLPQRRDWSLFIGPEGKLLDALRLGGHGGVSGGGNLFPKLYVKLCEAYRGGNIARAQELQAQIQRVSASIYHIGKHISSVIKGIKCAAACHGLCEDFVAEPFQRFSAGDRALVESRMKELEIELGKLNL
jgi:2-dehydro-3-deoxy-D-pentonate aldolase